MLASLFTLMEVGGLFAIIVAATYNKLPIGDAAFSMPPSTLAVWPGVAFGSLLAFFAFIGFEDLANVVEEAKSPQSDLPKAMALTLAIATVLYVWIAAIAIAAVPVDQLAAAPAPLTLVYRQVAGISPAMISAIAIVATLNTALAQMTMAARVLYGMATLGDLPPIFSQVHRHTATPVVATAAVVAVVLLLALVVPFEQLAEWTSLATLLVFALVNASLLWLRLKHQPVSTNLFRVPLWVPALGLLTSLAMMMGSALSH